MVCLEIHPKCPKALKLTFPKSPTVNQRMFTQTLSVKEAQGMHAASLVETNFLEAEGGVQNLANALF